jgi:hypothetical protein
MGQTPHSVAIIGTPYHYLFNFFASILSRQISFSIIIGTIPIINADITKVQPREPKNGLYNVRYNQDYKTTIVFALQFRQQILPKAITLMWRSTPGSTFKIRKS